MSANPFLSDPSLPTLPADAQHLVSVVTPFYNTEDYLAECIESVLHQSYHNWEYILVNNCSTDSSCSIAARYARRDPRIRLIHNVEFLSQVRNYNQALKHISPQSKYCKVVQADDWIYPQCLSKMVEVAECNESIAIVSAYSLQGTTPALGGLPYNQSVFSGAEVCRMYFLYGLYFFGSPTCVLYRSDLVRERNSFFSEASAPFEDSDICFELLRNNDFGFVHELLAFQRREDTSMLGSITPFGFYRLTRLQILIRYGQYFLTPSEYADCKREIEWEYFNYLGRSLVELRERRFWQFHREGLEAVEMQLISWPLVRFALVAFLEKATSPTIWYNAVQKLCRSMWRSAEGWCNHLSGLLSRPFARGGAPSRNRGPLV